MSLKGSALTPTRSAKLPCRIEPIFTLPRAPILALQQFRRPRGCSFQRLHGRKARLDQHLHFVMHAKPRRSSRNGVRSGVNFASCRYILPSEIQHVLKCSLELLAIFSREAANLWGILVPRREILDLPLPREDAIHDIPRNI